MKKVHKIIRSIEYAGASAFILAMTLGAFWLTAPIVLAEEGGGNAGDQYDPITGGSCAKGSEKVYWDTCYGATWRLYEATSDNIVIPKKGNVPGDTVIGCKTFGGSYYRLGLEAYNPSVYNSTHSAEQASLGYQAGLVQVRSIVSPYGSGNTKFKQSVKGSKNWDEVEKNFHEAQEYAKKHPEFGGNIASKNWEDVKWFCWKEGGFDENAESTFGAYSWAVVDGTEYKTSDIGVDAEREESIVINEDEVTVSFRHQLGYGISDNFANEQFSSTYTDWNSNWDYNNWGNISDKVTLKSGQLNTNGRYDIADGGKSNQWSHWFGEKTYTVKVPDTGSVKLCSKIDYQKKNIVWQQNEQQVYIMDNNASNGNEDSSICVIIEKPGDAEFSSQSTVRAMIDPNDPDKFSSVSEIDGMLDEPNPALSRFNIDNDALAAVKGGAGLLEGVMLQNQSTYSVDFWHQIYYDLKRNNLFASADQVNGVKTDWTITTRVKKATFTSENGQVTSVDTDWQQLSTSSGAYNVGNPKSSSLSGRLANGVGETVSINLDEGQMALVCSTIKYKTKNLSFKLATNGDVDGDRGHLLDHQYYIYEANPQNDSGSSEACLLIARGKDPEGTPWSGKLGGNPNSDPMYADEMATIGWNVNASYHAISHTRRERLSEFQAFSFVSPAGVAYNGGMLENTHKVSSAYSSSANPPCNYFASLYSGGGSCTVIVRNNGVGQYFDARKDEKDIVVPQEVGRKHAVSAGYYYHVDLWECVSWYRGSCVKYDWVYHPELNYWYIFNTASRSIFKKPSMAIWNGSLFANGGVSTSLSARYNFPTSSPYMEWSDHTTNYGSWSEYLITAGSSVGGMTSGTVLANGVDYWNGIMAHSPLTIANASGGSLGNSKIPNDMILRQRLQDYIFNDQSAIHASSASSAGLSGTISGTKIIVADGVFEIDHDIEISDNASTIYNLPQVLIYAKGGINIRSDVGRIDAWLVTDGTLNTCSDFKAGNGGTNAKTHDGGVGNTECSKQLQINGPVIAGNGVKLNRTYGSDGTNGDTDSAGSSKSRAATAEIFNYSADSYMWAYAHSSQYNSSYSESYSRELPPRY